MKIYSRNRVVSLRSSLDGEDKKTRNKKKNVGKQRVRIAARASFFFFFFSLLFYVCQLLAESL